ncbi:hypothetical protein [Comamonas aquatilis]|uniref:hypothetical protein n=1 Tax=Comamonas aquatilis TaxID=1778406 RepID=UPI0039EEE63A
MKTSKKANTGTAHVSAETAPHKALRRTDVLDAGALSPRFFNQTPCLQALDLTIDINWPYWLNSVAHYDPLRKPFAVHEQLSNGSSPKKEIRKQDSKSGGNTEFFGRDTQRISF